LKQKEFEAKNKTLEGDLIKAQSAMTLLKKEYEHLKVQSREADRGALFEASVVSEIVRLRTTSSQSLDEMNGHHDHQGALTIRTNDESNKNALNSPNLTALSSAYTTLESEFRKMKLSMENDATTDVSQENDLKSLQNEVIALQEQVRAGDEWMTMAVGRMNDMAAENADLQEQIDAKINNKTEIEDDMIVNIRREHETENNKLKKESEALSTELERAKKDNEEIRNDHSRQIQHMREEMISLEQELDIEREKNKEQNDAPSYSIDAGTVQTLERKVEQLLKEVEEKETLMTERNKTAEASLDALRKECDSIKLEKEEEIEKLNNELSTCSNIREEIETLGQSSTSDENNLVKNEESSLKMENEDLCRRIIELETKLTESNEHSRHIEESQSLELVNEESKVLKKELEMRALEMKRVSTQLADAQNEVETLKKNIGGNEIIF